MWGKPYRSGIAIESLVIKRNTDAHGILYRGIVPFPRPMFVGSGESDTGEIIQETPGGPSGTPFQLFYGKDMKQRCLDQEWLRVDRRELRAKIRRGESACPLPGNSQSLTLDGRLASSYCAAKTRSALPGVPDVNTYPEPTKTMPPATVGPGAAIEPPLAGT